MSLQWPLTMIRPLRRQGLPVRGSEQGQRPSASEGLPQTAAPRHATLRTLRALFTHPDASSCTHIPPLYPYTVRLLPPIHTCIPLPPPPPLRCKKYAPCILGRIYTFRTGTSPLDAPPTIFYYIILYYIILYSIILYCIISYYVLLYYIILYYIICYIPFRTRGSDASGTPRRWSAVGKSPCRRRPGGPLCA